MTIDSCRCEKRVVYSQDSSACVEPASITIYTVGSTVSDDDQHKIVVYRQFMNKVVMVVDVLHLDVTIFKKVEIPVVVITTKILVMICLYEVLGQVEILTEYIKLTLLT